MNDQLTLSELNGLIKESLELSFPEQLWVIAEIAELKVNRTGHCYIELVEKDESSNEILARSRATIWSWQYRFIQPYFETATGQTLQAGLKVLVAITVELHSVYGMSLNVKDIDPNYTLGDLARKRQEVINKLMEEGVFDMNKEIPLSEIPARIAIISSPNAAGYEDFINQLTQNEQGYKFYTKLFPATMQGNDASPSIISAFEYIYELEDFFDAVVLIRGGGSQLDLVCFDDYDLAVNITQFPLPVLTGIGHEKDESIADLVANTKLKTPTAVAEFLIGRFDEVANEIQAIENDFTSQVEQFLNEKNNQLNQVLKLFKPIVTGSLEKTGLILKQLASTVKPITNELIEKQHVEVNQLTDHLKHNLENYLKDKENRLHQLSHQIQFRSQLRTNTEIQLIEEKQHQLSRFTKRKFEKEIDKINWLEKTKQLVDPKHILKRGFSIALKDGKAVKNADQLNDGDQIEIILNKGKAKTIVKK